MQKQLYQHTITAACDEQILVVKRELIFQPEGPWTGLKQCDYDWYLWAIEHYGQFHSRIAMEDDQHYKQIIPYLVFMHKDHVFVVERKQSATERRLAGKTSIGIGGHIRKEDILGSTIFDWAQREFHEEVSYHDHFEFEPLGIVNDDRDSVGKVHLGFVFIVRGATSAISIKSELKQGTLVPLSSITDTTHFESWSQIILPYLA
jgi:predicted NUDIX family phosphoesterase